MKLSGLGDPENPATEYTVGLPQGEPTTPLKPRLTPPMKEPALERLGKLLPPGSHVYAILRYSSNQWRRYSLYAYPYDHAAQQARPWWITGLVCTATGTRFHPKSETISVRNTGGGNLLEDVLDDLSRKLHGTNPGRPWKAGKTLHLYTL